MKCVPISPLVVIPQIAKLRGQQPERRHPRADPQPGERGGETLPPAAAGLGRGRRTVGR